MTDTDQWAPDPRDIQSAVAALVARLRGRQIDAAMIVAEAGKQHRSYQMLDATWWIVAHMLAASNHPDPVTMLEDDLLRLADINADRENE